MTEPNGTTLRRPDVCFRWLKCCTLIFNTLFLLLGCAAFGMGVWVWVSASVHKFFDCSTVFQNLGIITLIVAAVGLGVVGVALLGCCGSIKGSSCLLATFLASLMLIFIVLVTAGCWLIIQTNTLHEAVKETLRNAIKLYLKDEKAKFFMRNIQNQFGCCGADSGIGDYYLYAGFPEGYNSDSVCHLPHYAEPCESPLFAFISDKFIVISALDISMIIVTLLGILLSILMYCSSTRRTV